MKRDRRSLHERFRMFELVQLLQETYTNISLLTWTYIWRTARYECGKLALATNEFLGSSMTRIPSNAKGFGASWRLEQLLRTQLQSLIMALSIRDL